MEFSTHPVFGIWIQPLGSRSSFWDLDAVFGIWIQSLGSGYSLWDLDAAFGIWMQSLECGFSLWNVDSTFGIWIQPLGSGSSFGIWIQPHTLVWDLWARGADPVSSSTSRILEFAAQPGEPQGWHLRVLPTASTPPLPESQSNLGSSSCSLELLAQILWQTRINSSIKPEMGWEQNFWNVSLLPGPKQENIGL